MYRNCDDENSNNSILVYTNRNESDAYEIVLLVCAMRIFCYNIWKHCWKLLFISFRFQLKRMQTLDLQTPRSKSHVFCILVQIEEKQKLVRTDLLRTENARS